MSEPQNSGKKSKPKVRDALRLSEREYTKNMSELQVAFSQMTLKPDESVIAIEKVSASLSEFLFEHKDSISIRFVWGIDTSILVYPHSISVAALSMLMAIKLGWEDRLISQLGTAALCHDLGKLKVPETILHKRTDLLPAERNFIKMHPQYGHDQLKHADAFNQLIRAVALQHHEHIDGSGYPKGLKGDKIMVFAKLACVANAFEEQLHLCEGKKAVSTDRALAKIQKFSGKKYESEYVDILEQCLGKYPPGTLVKLSNKSTALVVGTHPKYPDRPHVIPYMNGKSLNHADVISLADDDSIQIESISDAHSLMGAQQSFFNFGKCIGFYFLSNS